MNLHSIIFRKRLFLSLLALLLLSSCGQLYEFHSQKAQDIIQDKPFGGTVSLKVAVPPTFNFAWGFDEFKLYVKEAVEKQYIYTLKKCFEGDLVEGTAETNIVVTALDMSIFPIASLVYDVRLFFRVEIYDSSMSKQETFMIYGFGSDSDGNRALEKAVANSFYQLLPSLEDLFVR